MKSFESIVKETMETILHGDLKILSDLRMQYENSHIEKIEKYKQGGFVHFKVDDNTTKVNVRDFVIGDVYIGTMENKYEIESLLFIRNGFISMFEFSTICKDKIPYKNFDGYFPSYMYVDRKREYDSFPI